jgi:hypothetical protein
MDVTYLLYREQVELDRAARSPSPEARAAHREMAQAYGELVHQHRRELVDAAEPGPHKVAPRF